VVALLAGAISAPVMGILGAGLGTTYAAIPGLIVKSVPQRDRQRHGLLPGGPLRGLFARDALAASILASPTSSSTGQPTVGGYTTVLWVAGSICVAAAVLAWVRPN
jgi:hypothetical protein